MSSWAEQKVKLKGLSKISPKPRNNVAILLSRSINAGKWASKLDQKKSHVMKTNGLATHAKDEIFDKEGNKFSECLEHAISLLEEWEHDDNKGLLHKLLCI